MDSRMIDIPFSQPFCKWMVGLESTLQLSDIQNIDGTLFKSLSQLNDVVRKKKTIENDPSHTIETLQLEVNNLSLDGVSIDDLGLDFVLPGYANIELKVCRSNKVIIILGFLLPVILRSEMSKESFCKCLFIFGYHIAGDSCTVPETKLQAQAQVSVVLIKLSFYT